MTVFTDKQAKEHLETVLEEAAARGEVRIRLGDGREFQLKALPQASANASPINGERRRDLSDLAGTWVEDPAFDQAIRDQDVIDPDLWK
jgi:hypothetical protein